MPAIITVENLSKAYRIGHKEKIPDTLVGAAKSWVRDPLRNLRNLRRLDTFSEENDADDIVWALRDVSFEIEQGEVLGIIGRNGAGKSTLLKILSNITEPTRGRAIIRGRISSLLEVGTGFHPEMTGRDNVYMNGTILGMNKKEIDRKFDEIVDFSGVERFLDTPIKRYSSGMQVRLAFAVAAHLEPEILIVDEVLAVGDTAFQKKCLGKMQEVSEIGRTVLFVSHNLQAVRKLSHRCVLISGGEVLMDGDPRQVMARYNVELRSSDIGTQTSISDLKVRRGSGQGRLANIKIRDEADRERSEFLMGEVIRFDVGSEIFESVKNLYLALYLRSPISNEVVTGVTLPLYKHPVSAGEHGRVMLEFPNTNLRPGEYPLYFWLGDVDGHDYDIIDGLLAPLTITTDKTIHEIGFDPSEPAGFFSIECRMLTHTVGHQSRRDRFG
jgi:lipopolysaccharide transport system ATP-binding protein